MARILTPQTPGRQISSQVCPFAHDASSSEELAVTSRVGAPAPPDSMVLYFMQGACLLPQSMQFCGVLVAQELVQRPHEVDLAEFARSRLNDAQVAKVIRAMNAVHVKNGIAAQWRPDAPLSALAAQAMYKLRRLGVRSVRPISHADVDGAWGSAKTEGIGRLFSFARVVPDFPCREHLPLNLRSASPQSLELIGEALRGLKPVNALATLLADTRALVVNSEMFREEKRAYRHIVEQYGSYTPQADAFRDRLAARVQAEIKQRNPELDWPAFRDYRHS